MKKKIVVLDADEHECQRICNLLEERHYPTIPMHSLSHLGESVERSDCIAVLLDIDSVPVDNRVIRELTLEHAGVRFLCASRDRFHPELKDAICYHIYACLNKPIDPEELFYWLRCIYEEENEAD
ncbi:MAG: hypothetical protein JSW39_27440 [Desulfobacterales bacterium]|nr:MAG: hypothetical protein JSW39_27440 [Desulfobacterales bacterium]